MEDWLRERSGLPNANDRLHPELELIGNDFSTSRQTAGRSVLGRGMV
jgi:hypothetical protein